MYICVCLCPCIGLCKSLCVSEYNKPYCGLDSHRTLKEVVIVSPAEYAQSFLAGPAQFGPDFGINNYVSHLLPLLTEVILCTGFGKSCYWLSLGWLY